MIEQDAVLERLMPALNFAPMSLQRNIASDVSSDGKGLHAHVACPGLTSILPTRWQHNLHHYLKAVVADACVYRHSIPTQPRPC